MQVEYQNLVDHVEQGMAEVALQMAEAESKKFEKQRHELEHAAKEQASTHSRKLYSSLFCRKACSWQKNKNSKPSGDYWRSPVTVIRS